MDQAHLFRMQQEQHDKAANLTAQVADLTAMFLHKRVKATEAGMLTKAHKEQYGNQTGVVTGILIGQVAGLEIAWEDGSTSKCLAHMVEIVA